MPKLSIFGLLFENNTIKFDISTTEIMSLESIGKKSHQFAIKKA